MRCECDDPPTNNKENLRRLLIRSLNKNQILILFEVSKNSFESVTHLLKRISKSTGISISTLKLNAKILKNLGLIDFGNSSIARLTSFGKYVAKILKIKAKERARSLTCFRISALGADDRSSNLLGPTIFIRKKNDLHENCV